MKQRILFTIALSFLIAFIGNSQIIYSDNFDENILSVEPTSAYAVSLSNDNLSINANGTAGAFSPFKYTLHNNGSDISINISNQTKLYIKVMGSSNPDLRIDIQDEDGFVSNLSPLSVRIDNEFTIYELDYSSNLQDGGYGGSDCTQATAPCPVDPSKIAFVQFFVNAAEGGYSGTIEIDWISFGEPLETPPPPSAYEVRYNQVSYIAGRNKTISVVAQSSFSNQAYTILDSSNNTVLSGTTGASSLWSDSGEHIANVDISEVDIEGTYRFLIDTEEITFNVSIDGYAELREEAFKYYYYNRSSTALESTHAGIYARPAGTPDDVVRVHSSAATSARPEGTVISAPKGWYDAGDYNKYVVNSGISTYTLLAAYEHYKTEWQSLQYNIPEQGGDLPDILDEVLWNLDWMLDMQDPNDGGVYHKLTAKNFSGRVMPAAYNLERFVVQKSTAAALNFAAVTAVASRIFSDYESVRPGFSAQLEQAAKDAYSWAKANPAIYYSQGNGTPVSDISTGEYGDTNVTDEFQWAAVELFITTRENTYRDDIDVSSIGGGTPSWPYSDPLALISIAQYTTSLASSINVTAANSTLISTADQLKNQVNTSPMKTTMSTNDYSWGSNGAVGNQLILLIRAYELTQDESYLDAAYTAMDYIFGRNGTGYSYVTGFGDTQVFEPHHRISDADGISAPIPGMIVGGPQNENNPDTGDCTGSGINFPSNLPASKYVDHWCSYSTNEITINWNAPLVYAMHALDFYQKESATLSINELEENISSVKIFPNPSSSILNIKFSTDIASSNIEIYSLRGKKVLSKKINTTSSSIDISNLTTGLYLVKVTTKNQSYTTKIAKK
ncbi:T9SS C-terminal target domain-containing protein [Aquimarina sp. AD1]|uniref:glycoside hydrolase family 9 protein n=1 Tax=Aquimarina sp. (strain AD1) TaxID=1714848 RepID=UPI000E4798F2|nr:glycoside hydrolase family 9 protein [Aquimarina sp. AD1]AXT57712.1 T9SS C-terminal target domain-containing protein [Aquimarina sp. AD1]RKN37035.1 T9SS C-terminal target domain-containing protein [Aquimarina sp. AD1]